MKNNHKNDLKKFEDNYRKNFYAPDVSEIERAIRPISSELELRSKSVRVAAVVELHKRIIKPSEESLERHNESIQKRKGHIAPLLPTEDVIREITDTAVFIDGIYEGAKSCGIDEKYIDQQLNINSPGAGYIMPSVLVKLDKPTYRKIINNAYEMQKRDQEKGLPSKLTSIITVSVCALFLGLSFLSSGLTGNVIGSLGNLNTKIIGLIFLFIGLTALLLISSRKFKS